MIKLNDESFYVGQIKQILHSFNLPMFPVYQEGSTYAIGEHYLKDGAIYVHDYVYDNQGNIKVDDEENPLEENKFVKYYKFGEFIDGLTTKLPISSNIYDSQTHEYLGNYLRFIRDYLGLDLMSLYNCCGYDSPRDFEATYIKEETSSIFSSEDSKYTLIMVPVKKGKVYTIGVDYHGDLEMACMHYDNNLMLDYDSKTNDPIMLDGTYLKIRGARFNHPFLYDKLVNMKHDGDTKEKTLKLFIKIPTSCKSSIVVLEGDFRKGSNENLYMDNTDEGIPNTYKQKLGDSPIIPNGVDGESGKIRESKLFMLNYDFVTKNELLSINLKQKILLSTRLLEYLSLQAIAPNSDVVDNIKRLQRTLVNKIDTYIIKQYGIWDDSMRKAIYKYIWNSGIIHNYRDMLSYCDKDLETKIGGLLSKYNDLNPKKKTFTNGEIGGR